MTGEDCAELRLLIQADADGELTPAEAARVAAHLGHCADCAGLPARLAALSAAIHREAPAWPAPPGLHDAVRARLAAAAPRAIRPPVRPALPWWRRAATRPMVRLGAPFGTGFALAACLALVLVLPRPTAPPGEPGLAEAVVSDHIRALQPGHLMDVVSTDQHTVKPWFDGRLDFAPPVKDLKAAGFPLTGGRLDYLDAHPAAALIYQRRQHLIDLFIWQAAAPPAPDTRQGSTRGYNFVQWRADGMEFWAVSDLDAGELADFVRLWRAP